MQKKIIRRGSYIRQLAAKFILFIVLGRKSEKVSCFFHARNPGERRTHSCHALIVKSPSSNGAITNPLFPPLPTRAARSCSLNMTKNRNTIPTRTKSPTKKSCSRPMCRQSMQTATLYGTLPKHRKNNGTPSLPGGSCLPFRGKSHRNSTPTFSVTTAGSFLFPKA